MTPMTEAALAIDLAALGAALSAALGPAPEPEPAAVAVRTARRVTMYEAKDHFDAGGDVVVHDRGHELTYPVTATTPVHNARSTTWKELREQVTQWKNRYPNQRYYIVPTSKEQAFGGPEPSPTTHTPPSAEAPKRGYKAPFTWPERVQPHASLLGAIEEVLATVWTGESKDATERRERVGTAIAEKIMELPIGEVEIAGARVEIGEPVFFDNLSVGVDGDGRAVTVVFHENAYPSWDW